ncbi:sigma-70 family RNA polymerase sigma factor [Peptostreptococcus equinus]|uniref:Sigma-70 family RNA polymerase sigma factor n=1 Tax=Peptostreptococcus equinus TaxID=3003601 RepID=A0ABY7JRK2_9FIRM|nr:sigma-70 family RNA polymerase sigma factor [Peptostreptococcus sp. CBA3647]WAW14317.1 sigma-70 family RNA polymerase sigma factor [Peptostreptococcus sp. CBA3647]
MEEIKSEITTLLNSFNSNYNKQSFDEKNKNIQDKLDRVDRALLWMGRNGCNKALDLFIISKLNQVKTVICSDNELSSYKNRGLEDEDLFQTGVLGVIYAAKKFDFRENILVRTYVSNNVKFSIKNAYRQYGNLYVSREAGSIYAKCSKDADLLDDKLSTKKLKFLSRKNNIDCKKISESILAIKNRTNILSINNDGEIEADTDFLERYKNRLVCEYEKKYNLIFDYRFALNKFNILTDKEKYVIESIFIKDRTQKDISKELECSVTAIGKIKKKALSKLESEFLL